MVTAASPSLGAVSLALTLVFASLAFMGVLTAATVIVRSSGVKQNLELLRGEVSDLTAAKARIEGERDQLQQELAHSTAEKAILRDLATSRPDVEALIGELRTMVTTIETGHQGLSRLVVEHGRTHIAEQR